MFEEGGHLIAIQEPMQMLGLLSAVVTFKDAVAAIIPSRGESGGVRRVVILMLLPCPRNGIYSTGDSLVM